MKKIIAIMLAGACFVATASAQSNESKQKKNAGQKIENGVTGAYKSIENGVVNGYQKIEDGVVNGYNNMEDKITGSFRTGSNFNYRKGYRADIELSTLIYQHYSVSTSHGYSFGNGFYLGGGVGFGAEFDKKFKEKPTFLVPIFVDAKITLWDTKASPFIKLRAGEAIDITNDKARFFICPALGLDIGRFSISAGYEYQKVHNAGQFNTKSLNKAKIGFSIAF